MKPLNFTNPILLGIMLMLTLWACKPDYLSNFPPYQKDLIEYQFEGLPAPIKSPFDGEMVHPMGKLELKTTDGKSVTVTLINTVPNLEIPEIGGLVYAEIIRDNQRLDKLEVADGEAGVGYSSTIAAPFIVLRQYGGENGELESATTYEVRSDSFVFIRKEQKGFTE